MQKSRLRTRIALTALTVLITLLLGACSGLEGLFRPEQTATVAPVAPDLGSLPLEAPIDPHRFVIESPEQSVIGVPQVVFTNEFDTLPDFALEYGLGYDELTEANRDVDPWVPGHNRAIVLPTQFVLPDLPREGLILNIATKRLFYYPADGIERDAETGAVSRQVVLTFPVGIGRVGWETPLGPTKVVSKAKDPTWWVPASVRKEHAEMGDPLPSVVPPGPENPLGTRVLKLEKPGYLIHGTNQPYGVGMRVSHGCVRLYPDNIEFLYELVDIGEPVIIINEPYALGQLDGDWYFEAHVPLEDDLIPSDARLALILEAVDATQQDENLAQIESIASAPNGMPVRIAAGDAAEVLMRVRRVHNTVEVDPDAPTLGEVREMIDEVLAEQAADKEAVN